MSKKKKPATQSFGVKLKNKWRSWTPAQKKLAVIGLIILVPILGYQSWKYYHIFRERHLFNVAEEQLLELQDEIIANVGEPTSKEFTRSCGYASAKFTRGTRKCTVSINYTYYPPDSELEAERFGDMIINATKKSKYNDSLIHGGIDFPDQFSPITSVKDYYVYKSQSPLYCSGGMTYVPIEAKSHSHSPGFYISTYCFISPAHSEHFPVNED